MKNFLNIARANAALSIMSVGSNIQNIQVDNIPNEWSDFPDINGCMWKKIRTDKKEDITLCFFKAEKGAYFPPHFHENKIKHIVILNKEGKFKLTTSKERKIYKFPNSAYIPKKITHAVEFLEFTRMIIMWCPKFENDGWTADFVKDKK